MGWADLLVSLFRRRAEQVTLPPLPVPPHVSPQVPFSDAAELVSPIHPDAIEETPETLESGRREQVERHPEALQRWRQHPARELAADLTCTIAYVDAEGHGSVRRISIRKVRIRDDRIYLVSFCHERQAIRHFLLERIQECWDCETGEVIDLASYIATLSVGTDRMTRENRLDPAARRITITLNVPDAFTMPPPDRGEPELQPRSAVRRAIAQRCGDGLRVLRFLALCDGVAAPAEEKVILEYAERACAGREIDLPPIPCDPAFVVTFARRLRPTPQSMLEAFGEIISRGRAKDISLLLDCVLKLVQADGKIHPYEEHFSRELFRILRGLDPGKRPTLS